MERDAPNQGLTGPTPVLAPGSPGAKSTVAAGAEEQKELLVKHGLVVRVLESLNEGPGQLDQAVAQGAEGRRIHVGAAVKLDVVGGEAVGVNRARFAGDPDLMAAWRSPSNGIGPSRPAAKPEGSGAPLPEGAVKPAA